MCGDLLDPFGFSPVVMPQKKISAVKGLLISGGFSYYWLLDPVFLNIAHTFIFSKSFIYVIKSSPKTLQNVISV